jgi:hypothetical protein
VKVRERKERPTRAALDRQVPPVVGASPAGRRKLEAPAHSRYSIGARETFDPRIGYGGIEGHWASTPTTLPRDGLSAPGRCRTAGKQEQVVRAP